MKVYQPSTIKELQVKHDFKFCKALGQNFLTDQNIVCAIVDGANITIEDSVIEIGPGMGVITEEIAKRAKKVVAIEIDSHLIPVLNETLRDYPNCEVINRDVLKTDLNEIAESLNSNVKILGNLPYYITTPIIMKILEDGVKAESITIMMQKEVADRIKAKPNSKDYGALTVAVQYYCEVEKVIDVPKEVFVPRPQVDSTVLKLTLRKEKPIEVKNRDLFFNVVKAGFGQRRKTLNNSLMGVKGITKDKVKLALENAGIDPIRRAETLTIEEFGELYKKIEEIL